MKPGPASKRAAGPHNDRPAVGPAALAAGLARELERGRIRLQALAQLAAQRRVRGHETAPVEVAVEALGPALLARVEHR